MVCLCLCVQSVIYDGVALLGGFYIVQGLVIQVSVAYICRLSIYI